MDIDCKSKSNTINPIVMKREEFIKLVSKIDQTFKDEFKAKYNSPELMWKKVLEPMFIKIEEQIKEKAYSHTLKTALGRRLRGIYIDCLMIINTYNPKK